MALPRPLKVSPVKGSHSFANRLSINACHRAGSSSSLVWERSKEPSAYIFLRAHRYFPRNMEAKTSPGRKKPLCFVSMNCPAGVSPPPDKQTWRCGWKESFCPQVWRTEMIPGLAPRNFLSAHRERSVSWTHLNCKSRSRF